MVIIKSNKAIGSVLGMGTHTWLEIRQGEKKITYSGAKGPKNILSVIKNYKRDYDRDAGHGEIIVPPPAGISESQWAQQIIASAEKITQQMHQHYYFCGAFPYGKKEGMRRANCCSVIHLIPRIDYIVIPPSHAIT